MPPCWQHITPGQPLTDALQALHQFVPADLINPETFTATNEGFIVWEGSTYSAYLTYDATQLIGRQVIVTYFSDVSWEQLLESYGEPEYTLIMSNMTHELGVMAYGFGVVYLDEGLFLRSLDDRDTSLVPPAISPQMTFDEVIFFEAGLNGLRKELRLGPDEPLRKWLVPWVGFQSFEQYCQTTYPDEAEWVCP